MRILEENGYNVTGLDLSQDMLNIASGRVKGELVNQDMREIRIDKRFNAIICLGSSFTYNQCDEDVEKALNCFYTHLERGGVLLFDNFDYDRFNPDKHVKWDEESQSFDDLVITRRSKSSGWNPLDGTWTTEWLWTMKKGDDTREVYDKHLLKVYQYSYLRDKLQQTGFRDIEKIENNRLMIKAEKANGSRNTP